MATASPSFYCLWREERIRETLFEMLPKQDVCSVRLANSACCNLVTKRLFLRTYLTFTANTFTKASRVQALSRIGHHIEHLTFHLAHSDATFLPPLIHPLTGREISFLYTPHTCMMSALTRPKYANTELGEVLTQQYPPLFHAATNVPSFLNAVKHMPNMRHLTIRCPGQDPKERYRRCIVDYALISLRISIERAPLHKLCKLSLSGVHPAAFNYLRHVPGFGSHPSAARRWRQIRKLYMSVDAWDFYGPSPGLDHLKIIDDFIRNMAPNLEKFSFSWINDNGSSIHKGPCPIALSGDPLFSPRPDVPKKLFNEVTGPMSPLPPAPHREALHMSRLRNLTLRNAAMNTPQLRDLVQRHKSTVREFDFENVSLTDGGSYEEAFSQLLTESRERGNHVWSCSRSHEKKSNKGNESGGEAGDGGESRRCRGNGSTVSASPTGHQSFRFAAGSHTGSLSSASSTVMSGPGAVASPDDVQLSSPSAAVAAVSRELLDLDVEGLESYLGLGAELPFRMDSPSDVSAPSETHPLLRTPPPPIKEVDEDLLQQREEQGGEDDGGLASDIAAAHEASLAFTTHFKKRRAHRSRRKHHEEGSVSKSETSDCRSRSRRHHRHYGSHHHHHHHTDPCDSRSCAETRGGRRHETSQTRSQSRSHSSRGRHHGRHKEASTTSQSTPRTPPPPPLPTLAVRDHPFAHRSPPPQPPQPRPAIVGQYSNNTNDDDDVFRPRTLPESPSMAEAVVAPLKISAPILAADASPVVLQPTVFDPSAMSTAASAASPAASGVDRPRTLSSPVSTSPAARHGVNDDGLSSIQRQILQEQEEAQNQRRRLMANDPDARTSALKKAKAAVLMRLGREFNKRMGREAMQAAAAATAATAAAAAASVSMSANAAASQSYGWGVNNYGANDNFGNAHSNATTATLSLLAGLRLRERLFGDSFAAATGSSSTAVPSVPLDHYQHHSMESNSAVVPLIFSRA